MSGNTEDRLAIAISSPNHVEGQFVASPSIPDGTGLTMATCVYNTINEFDLLDDVKAVVFDTTAVVFDTTAVVFDTTASNTGKWSVSVTRFEIFTDRALS